MTARSSTAIKLRAFVGRSFLDVDRQLWLDIKEMLESFRRLGFEFEDANEAQIRSISDKVREGIERNDIYIGILTRRREFLPSVPPSLISRLRGQI